jgi:integrase
LEEWHHGIANSAARVRTRKGDVPKFRPHAVTPEAISRRAATANRVLTILKAALNDSYHEGRIPINEAWQRVKAFRKVDSARVRYLSDDEARRLVNACPADFRALVTGGLLTGCRYGELAALVVEDFNADSGTLTIRTSKSGKLVTSFYRLKASRSLLINVWAKRPAHFYFQKPVAGNGRHPISSARWRQRVLPPKSRLLHFMASATPTLPGSQ